MEAKSPHIDATPDKSNDNSPDANSDPLFKTLHDRLDSMSTQTLVMKQKVLRLKRAIGNLQGSDVGCRNSWSATLERFPSFWHRRLRGTEYLSAFLS